MKKLVAISLFVLACAGAYAAQKGGLAPEKQLEIAVRGRNVEAAQRAINDGATNVSVVLKDKLRTLNPTKFGAKIPDLTAGDIKILTVLIDNSGELLDAKTAEALITHAISQNCTSGTKTVNVRDIISISMWDYDVDAVMDNVALFAAENDNNPNVINCVFNQVASSKLAGPEFLDRAGVVAEQHNAVNMIEFIGALRTEMAKMQAK